MRKLTCLLALSAVLVATRSAFGVIVAGDNPSGPSIVTTYNGDINGFTVVETVSYNGAAGAWHKELINSGTEMILSGTQVPIHEHITNSGPSTWTDWHEEILANPEDSPFPDFLFTAGSLHVDRNGVPLNQGTDYTLVATTADPVLGNTPGGDWVALSIFFSPSAAIQPGDILGIRKDIFEVFADADVWAPGEFALLGQYPTVPEPASLGLAIVGLAGLGLYWRRRRNTPGSMQPADSNNSEPSTAMRTIFARLLLVLYVSATTLTPPAQ
jgi:hypothetical protein